MSANDSTSVTTAIVESVADREDCDPDDLPPLHNTVDTEAVEALEGDAQIVFKYEGYVVSVEERGYVRVFQGVRQGRE
ncbi:HalOD1 output domain-containing protein [Halostagnicola bangensis]